MGKIVLLTLLVLSSVVFAQQEPEKPDMLCTHLEFSTGDTREWFVSAQEQYIAFVEKAMERPTLALVTREYLASLNILRHRTDWILYDAAITGPPEEVVLRKLVSTDMSIEEMVKEMHIRHGSAEAAKDDKGFFGKKVWELYIRLPETGRLHHVATLSYDGNKVGAMGRVKDVPPSDVYAPFMLRQPLAWLAEAAQSNMFACGPYPTF